jgi:hypothetical protein
MDSQPRGEFRAFEHGALGVELAGFFCPAN